MDKIFDCVLCGSCVVDLLVRPVPLETPIGKSKLVPTEPILVATGGIVSNSGIAMARLGMKVAAFTYVGNDDWGPVIRKRYEADIGTKGPSAVTYLAGGHELPPGRSEVEWLGERIKVFKTAVKDFKGLGGAFA